MMVWHLPACLEVRGLIENQRLVLFGFNVGRKMTRAMPSKAADVTYSFGSSVFKLGRSSAEKTPKLHLRSLLLVDSLLEVSIHTERCERVEAGTTQRLLH